MKWGQCPARISLTLNATGSGESTRFGDNRQTIKLLDSPCILTEGHDNRDDPYRDTRHLSKDVDGGLFWWTPVDLPEVEVRLSDARTETTL